MSIAVEPRADATSEDFGLLLRRFRTGAGFSQEALAERAMLSVPAVSLLERGLRRAPYRTTVAQLCDALSLSLIDRRRMEKAAVRHRDSALSPTNNEMWFPEALLGSSLPPIIGRIQERDEVTALLLRDDVNVVTLVGPGGIGKTRLALALLSEIAHESASNTIFVGLAAIDDPALVLATIATSLGVRAEGEGIVDAVARQLGDRRVVLLLDNAEHVIEKSAESVALLASVPGLKFLVTSRSPLHLRSEHVVRLEPLSPAAAVELFIERAQAAGTRTKFDPFEPSIAQIVRLLDGLPLAIELAAARTRFEPLEALASRLERRLDVLIDGPRDAGERHRTMRAAIQWSYDLCNEDERRVLRALSMFSGGCTVSSVMTVLGYADERRLVDCFVSLFDKSLVLSGGDGREPRFTMLQTIREFAAQQHAEDPQAPRLRRAFAEHLLTLAEGLAAQLTSNEQGRAVAALESEHDNIRGALAWARDECEKTLGLRLVGVLWRFWSRRGYFAEGSAWCATMLALPDYAPDPSEPATRARALLAAGMLMLRRDDSAAAKPLLESSLALHRRIGDARGSFFALNGIGLLARACGDLAQAQKMHEESLAARRVSGRPRDVSVALTNLGVLALDCHNLDQANALFDQSLAEMDSDADTDPWVRAFTLHHSAIAARRLGERDRSLRLFEESLGLRRESLDTLGVVQTLVSLGELALENGDETTALKHYRRAIERNRRIGAPDIFIKGFEALAWIFARQEDPERATRLLAKATSLRSRRTAFAANISSAGALRLSLIDVLGVPAFETAWEQGAAVDSDQAALIATAP